MKIFIHQNCLTYLVGSSFSRETVSWLRAVTRGVHLRLKMQGCKSGQKKNWSKIF